MQNGRLQLQQAILSTLTSPPAEGRIPIVTSRLCSALANIALHTIPEGWPNMLPQLIQSLHAGPNETMLELLEQLPAQLIDAVITKDRWKLVEKTLNESNAAVLSLIQELLVRHPGHAGLVFRCLKCLSAWVQFGVSMADLFARPLLESVFMIIEARPRQNVFRAAIDVVGDVFVNPIMFHHSASLLAVCKRVGALRPLMEKALREEDTEMIKDLTVLAVSVAENQAHVLSDPHQDALSLIDLIVLAMASPDWDVAEVTFDFWLKLQDHLTRIKPPVVVAFVPASKVFAEQMRDQTRKSHFIPRFVQAIGRLMHLVEFPNADELHSWESGDFEELRLKRDAASDVFIAASLILETEMLTVASNVLMPRIVTAKSNPAAWQPVEVVLFMTQTVVGWHHNVDENLHLIFNMFTELPQIDRVVSMTLTLIGVSAQWLKSHQDLLMPSLNYVLQALARDYARQPTGSANMLSSVPSGAPQALLDLASICGGLMTGQIPNIIGVYESVAANVDPQGKCTVVRALTHIVSHLPPEEIGGGIQWMVRPIMERLTTMLNPRELAQEVQAVRAEITLLSCAIPFHVEPSTPHKAQLVSNAFPIAEVYPFIDRLLREHHAEFLILEACLEFFSLLFEFFHISMGSQVWGRYLEGCVAAFGAGQYSHVLDSVCTVMGTITGKTGEVDEDTAKVMGALASTYRPAFESLCSVALPAIKAGQNGQGTVGELTEAYYKLVSETMSHFPEVLASSTYLAAIVETALLELGSPAQQVAASQAVIDSLGSMTLCFDKAWGAPLRDLFNRFGSTICRLVLSSLAGLMPWHSFNPLADVLWNVIAEFRDESRAWLTDALHAPVFDKFQADAKGAILESLVTTKLHRKFRAIVSDFAINVRS